MLVFTWAFFIFVAKKYEYTLLKTLKFYMEILARAVGRRKEAVAQVQIIRGTGQFIINDKLAKEYLVRPVCPNFAV